MQRLFRSFCFLLLSIGSGISAKAVADDPVSMILQASNDPFIPFVHVAIQTDIPQFPFPGDKLSDPKLSQVRDVISSRVLSLDLNSNKTHEIDFFGTLSAMCSLRNWLLKRPAYSNITITFNITQKASLAVLAGLENGSISTDDALVIVNSLDQNIPLSSLLRAAEGGTPKSKAILEFMQKADSESLLELSNKIAEEDGEGDFLSRNPVNFRNQIDPSEFVFNAAATYDTAYATKLWVEYVSKGGILNLKGQALRSDLEAKIPAIKGKGLKTPDTGNPLEWVRMEIILEESRRRTATHL